MATVEMITADGIDMPVSVFGNGSRSLVILPGLSVKNVTESADTVARTFSEFGTEFTVYLLDRRQNPPSGYSVQMMAQDTRKAIEYLGLKRVNLYGASQGGMITLLLAAQMGERIEKAAVASTAARVEAQARRLFSSWASLAEQGKKNELAQAFAQSVYSPETVQRYAEVFRTVGETYTDTELKRFAVMAKGMSDFDCLPLLTEIKCPLLALASRGDRVFGAEPTCRIARQSAGELVLYGENYGHAVYDEAPDFIGRLIDFFTKEQSDNRTIGESEENKGDL